MRKVDVSATCWVRLSTTEGPAPGTEHRNEKRQCGGGLQIFGGHGITHCDALDENSNSNFSAK